MGINLIFINMKFSIIAALVATVSAGSPLAVGLGHAVIPATREDYDNAKELWKGDWAKYRAGHPADQDCSISESDNTGKVPNNAPNPGNAEVPDSAREADGAPAMTVVREPHSQIKLQVSSQTIDQFGNA